MKKLVLIFCIGLFAFTAFAQDGDFDNEKARKRNYNQRHETLFNRAHVIGGFGGPIFEYSNFGDNFEVSAGGGGGLIIDNFFIGGYGLGSVDNSILENDWESLEIGHGGLWGGYTLNPYKLVHLYSSVKLGWGGLKIKFEDDDFDYQDAIFVATPELGAELNIFRFFKIGFSGGYRFVSGIDSDLSGYEKGDFNNFVGTLTLRFGAFGNPRKWR